MWKTSTIDEICNVEYGTRVVRRKDSGTVYPVYGGGGETFFLDKTNRQDRVVISRFAMSEQCTRFVKGKFFLNDSGLTLSPKTNNISQEFLDKIIISLNSAIYQVGRGTAQRNLDMKKFRLLTITYPTLLSEQQRIIAKLDATFAEIDKVILLKQNSILNFNKLFTNQLNSLFLDNSNNWKDTTLGAYYDVRDGTHDSPKYVPQGIPLVTSKNLKKGKIDLTKIKYIKNKDYLLIKKRSGVSVGDVLMAMIGTIGNPVIIKKDSNFAIKNVALFKIKENQSSDFLKFYLNSSFVLNKMMKDAKGTTQQFVGLGYLRSFPIKVPSFEEQKKISLQCISLENNIEILINKYNLIINNYISLKNSLLVELLNESKVA